MSTDQQPTIPLLKPQTVKDVARASGTSPSTVSRVLTGRAPVAPEKREAVLKAISEMNYRPNLLARSLKTRATYSLGLLINDVLNPFYGALARGVEDVANEAGYAVIFCNTNEDPNKELEYLRMLKDKAVDGVILAPTGANKNAMEDLLAEGLGLVQIDRQLPDLSASSVTLCNESGGYTATRHLLSQGHKRIGFVTYSIGQMTVSEREQGYRRALNEPGGAAAESKICRVGFDLADTTRLVSRMLRSADPPTALVAANNRIALAVLGALKELKLTVRKDIALVVFDDLEIFALITPSLSAVAQPAYDMGRKAAEFLFEQLASEERIPTQTAVFQPELIIRESSSLKR